MGGFGTFKRKWAQQLYDIIFNVSFWTCGTVCALNLIYQKTPYHNFPTDALTAYVHLPAWQSWLTWRRFVKTPGCAELLSKARSNTDRAAKLDLILRVVGWIVLAVQCVMVADVLVGFSMPRTLELAAHGSPHEYHKFESVHALIMWAVIPPVIAAMFSSYVMFGFFAMLHILDILATRDLLARCIEPLAAYYSRDQKADAAGPTASRARESRKAVRATPRAQATPRGQAMFSSTGGDSCSVADASEFGAPWSQMLWTTCRSFSARPRWRTRAGRRG